MLKDHIPGIHLLCLLGHPFFKHKSPPSQGDAGSMLGLDGGVSRAPRAARISEASKAIRMYVWSQHRLSPASNCLRIGGKVYLSLTMVFGATGFFFLSHRIDNYWHEDVHCPPKVEAPMWPKAGADGQDFADCREAALAF